MLALALSLSQSPLEVNLSLVKRFDVELLSNLKWVAYPFGDFKQDEVVARIINNLIVDASPSGIIGLESLEIFLIVKKTV